MLRYIILLSIILTIYANNIAIIAIDMQYNLCKEDSSLFIEGCLKAISNMNYLFAITIDDNVFSITTSNIQQEVPSLELKHDLEQFNLHDVKTLHIEQYMINRYSNELIDDLYLPSKTKHFYKNTSSIAKKDAFIAFLDHNKIKHIVLGGVAGEDCVDASAKDLVALGYDVSIYLPAVGFLSEQGKKTYINIWLNLGINIKE
jgi:nicotinamidase-related amidase